jgi:hypothetical protein
MNNLFGWGVCLWLFFSKFKVGVETYFECIWRVSI